MKKLISLLLVGVMALGLGVSALASGEASGAPMTAEERAWWDSFQVPAGMEDVTLFPDKDIALRQKNYETVCRYMQGLSPYLYLLYADDMVSRIAYDFALTKDSMRPANYAFTKAMDAVNAETYPDWAWEDIRVFQSHDPNVFLVECGGRGTVVENGQPVRTHYDHYLHRFTLADGKIVEYIEFNNPIQELTEMGYRLSPPGGGGGSGEASSDEPKEELPEEVAAQLWWDSFKVPDGMEDIVLFPDDRIELRQKNYETVCRFMQGLSPYLYLLYADEFCTGVAYDFGGTTDPFYPVMCKNLSSQKALDKANAESYDGWVYENFRMYQSDDPNVFLVECDGHCDAHADHYVHEFILTDGKISQYIEFNSPLNELIENGYEVPDIH